MLLRHRIAALLALLLVSACATTQEGPRREPPPSSTFFWKVSAPDRPGVVYLLGTVHLGDPAQAALDRSVLDAVDEADRVVFEIAPDTVDEQHIAALTQKYGMQPEGESLFAALDEGLRQRLVEEVENLGLALEAVDRTRPWLASMLLSLVRMQLDGFDPDAGVERLLAQRVSSSAAKEGEDRRETEMLSLETIEEQLKSFADLPREVELEMLRHSVEEVAAQRSQVKAILAAYREGDAEALAALIFENAGKSPGGDAAHRALFDERNERMTARLLPWFDAEGSTVVAVGVGHMLGSSGIPARLLEKGYVVEPVPPLGLIPLRTSAPPSASGAFRDEAGGFEAAFHVEPLVQRGSFAGQTGHPAERMRAIANANLVELSVEVHAGLPEGFVDDPAALDAAFTRVVHHLGSMLGTLESSERVTVQGHPAVRFDVRTETHRLQGLVAVRGVRMYTVIASRASDGDPVADEERAATMQRFLESFRFLE